MADTAPPDDLREFLRTRRARISPERAGLPPQVGIRRVPGLRREEVALLAGISAEYYERFERGRNRNVSTSVLEAVARVLCLDAAERDHLYALASTPRTGTVAVPTPRIRPGLRRVLDGIDDVPALILGPRSDVLAINRLGLAFYSDIDTLRSHEQNIVRWLFLVPAARELYDDWAATARTVVAGLRRYAGSHQRDPKLAELVRELSVTDPDFRRWWAEHDVYRRDHGSKRYHHPVVGDLQLAYEAFTPVGEPELVFGLHTVEPNSPSATALSILASWTTAPAHDRHGG